MEKKREYLGKKNIYSVITNREPKWIEEDIPSKYVDKDFLKIIMFFVINSPCKGQSQMHIPLQHYGWKEDLWFGESYLKGKINKIIFGEEEKLFYYVEKKQLLKEKIKDFDLGEEFYKNRDKQRIAIAMVNKEGCKNKYMSFFYHIRNSLAHGRLAMYPVKNNDIMFVMEDGADIKVGEKARFGVSARIVILKSTLLNIIDILKAGPKEEKDYTENAIVAIKNGKNTRTKIQEELKMDKEEYKRTINKLKKENKIEFKESTWKLKIS